MRIGEEWPACTDGEVPEADEVKIHRTVDEG
jgi:hypothetical protein